jgi:adenylate cyclase class IV
MILKNYEFKAAVKDINDLEQKLLKLNPVFKGDDHQVDTYFNVNSGRLKLREGEGGAGEGIVGLSGDQKNL